MARGCGRASRAASRSVRRGRASCRRRSARADRTARRTWRRRAVVHLRRERHVVERGEARVALADRPLRIAHQRHVAAAGQHPRAGIARRAPRPCPPTWSPSGCVSSTIGGTPEPRQHRQDARRPGEPGRPVSTTSAACVAADHDLADDARAVGLLALQHPVGDLVDDARRPSRSAPPRAAGTTRRIVAARSGSGRPSRTRSARSNVSSARERKRHRRDPRALDQQLLEALGEPCPLAAPAMSSSSAAASSATRPNAPVAVHDDAPLVDLLARGVALRQPPHARAQVVRRGSASRSRSSIHAAVASSNSAAALSPVPRRSGASTAQPRSLRPAAAGPCQRLGLAALVERHQHARRVVAPGLGQQQHGVERDRRRDVELEPLAEAAARGAHVVRDDARARPVRAGRSRGPRATAAAVRRPGHRAATPRRRARAARARGFVSTSGVQRLARAAGRPVRDMRLRPLRAGDVVRHRRRRAPAAARAPRLPAPAAPRPRPAPTPRRRASPGAARGRRTSRPAARGRGAERVVDRPRPRPRRRARRRSGTAGRRSACTTVTSPRRGGSRARGPCRPSPRGAAPGCRGRPSRPSRCRRRRRAAATRCVLRMQQITAAATRSSTAAANVETKPPPDAPVRPSRRGVDVVPRGQHVEARPASRPPSRRAT